MTTSKAIVASLLSLTLVLAAESQSLSANAFGPKKQVSSESENMEIRDKWAIVVGINRFSDPAIPAQKLAQKSSSDLARALKDADSGHFGLDHVLVVNGADASKAGINQTFNDWLFKKALPGDLVIIYINSRLMKNAAGEPVFCANDSKASEPDSGIDLAEFLTAVRQRVGSSHVFCMLDTSPVNDEKGKSDFDVKKLANKTGVTILSASELFRPSNDDPAFLQTYFVHYFVEALKTGGGNYPLAMIAEYVWQKVQESTKANPQGAQTAIMGLANEQDQTISVPIGMVVKSSFPAKTVAIGHPLDSIGMNRPDIVAPTLSPSKTTVKMVARNQSVPEKPATPVKAQAKPQSAADMEEDEDFDPSLDLRPYVARIKQTIQSKWQTPKGFENRKVTTVFSVLRNGKISNPEITESSGNEDVDKSALAALDAASPLEALPKGAPRSVDIKYTFDYKTKVQTTQQSAPQK